MPLFSYIALSILLHDLPGPVLCQIGCGIRIHALAQRQRAIVSPCATGQQRFHITQSRFS